MGRMSSIHNSPAGQENRLSGKQMEAALLLAQGKTIAATAQQVGVHEKTIDNWKRLPRFMDELHKIEDSLYNEQLRYLKRASSAAIACLIRNMGEKVSAYVQVQAASKILDLGLEIHRIAELEQEIAQLRAQLNQSDDLAVAA